MSARAKRQGQGDGGRNANHAGSHGRPSAQHDELELFARCASGFEPTLAQELKGLGLHRVRPLQGGVAFFGPKVDAYRACLWSRVATRVQLVLARVGARDANELYQQAVSFAWEEHVRPTATVAVEAHGTNTNLRNTSFTALKVKDALCDRLRERRGTRPNVDARQPDFQVNVALHDERATLYLNLSGPSLHRRGYRAQGVQTEAPLKETLAAGMLLAADWPKLAQAGGWLVDPMCGSGTLAVEAALMATNTAPGLLRDRWGFAGWLQHDPKAWDALLEEAELRRSAAEVRACVMAGDIDEQAIGIARDNARRARVAECIWLHVDDAARLGRHLRHLRRGLDAPGLLVCNPPYGKRLLQQDDLPLAYAALASAFEALPPGWHAALITPDAGIDSSIGRIPHTTLACHNGPIATWLRLYHTDAPRCEHEVVSLAGIQRTVNLAEPNSAQLAARLRKVGKERRRWARDERTSAYRVYDADLPEFAMSVDLYLGIDARDARFAHIVERPRPARVDEQRAARRLADATQLVSAVFDIPASNLLVDPWPGQEGKNKRPAPRHTPVSAHVLEHGLAFELDLMRPNEELPLCQRAVRQLAGSLAGGKRVAGLFAWGGSALVHAGRGNAREAIAVDTNARHLGWIRNAFHKNGLTGVPHRCVRMDVRQWLAREARSHHLYDLVLCMPPEWLSPKETGGRDWNLRRDLKELLLSASRVLTRGGTILYACERPEYLPGQQALADLGLDARDVSATVLPHDFERTHDKPCCLLLQRGDRP